MSNRLLREPDVIKAILENKEMFRTGRDIQRFAVVVGDIPAVHVERNLKLAYERGKADRPQGKVNAVEIYEKAKRQLDRNEITLGEFEKIIEPLRHLSYDRPQGKWIEYKNAEEISGTLISNYECSLCHEWQTLISNFCPSCGARMRGTGDEAKVR